MYRVYIYKINYVPDNLKHDEEEKFLRFGYITSDNGDVLSHIKQACQGVFIAMNGKHRVHAHILSAWVPKNAHHSALTIGFTETEHENLRQSNLAEFKKFKNDFNFSSKLKFELKHFYFQSLHNAIKFLPDNVIHKLTPTVDYLHAEDDTKLEVSFSVPAYKCLHLDQMQINALKAVLSSSAKVPVLIAGPFGTGKTRMLARLAHDILKSRATRVLICAHHQASADTFINYFGSMKEDNYRPWYVQMVRVTPSYYNLEEYQKYKKYFKRVNEITWDFINTKRLVITTLGTVLKLRRNIHGDKTKFFTHILIDEGAQTREPETVSPLLFAGESTKIIIAGDHCQVNVKCCLVFLNVIIICECV